MSEQHKVVVIGAGLGGMSAAIMLAKAGMHVTADRKEPPPWREAQHP